MCSSNFRLDNLVRPNIKTLKAYRSARDDFDSGILLDANENALGPVAGDGLHRYPDPYQKELKRLIADFRGVKPEQIFTGVGSDEAIDLLIRIFCAPGKDAILATPPTYGMYKVSSGVNDVKIIEAPLTPDFQLQPELVLEKADERVKLIFLCSPNNPTANLLNVADIKAVIEGFNGVVVVDEAYVDFADAESMAPLVAQYPNLVVMQTLSKSFGLAGVRLGMAISNDEIIAYMNKIKAPYNINALTSKAAIAGMTQVASMKDKVAVILNERQRVANSLNAASFVEHVYPSDANFLLFRVPDALNVYKALAEKEVIIRYRGNELHCDNCLRVTIGTSAENDQFLNALNEVCS